VRATPGVRAAGIADYLPFDLMTRSRQIHIEPATDPKVIPPTALMGSASPGFLPAFGARLLQGREFTQADNATGRSTAVINESFARRLWKEEPAVGKRFSLLSPNGPWIDVVGVIQDGKYDSLNETGRLFFYTNLEDEKGGNGLTMNLVVRTGNDPQTVIAAIRREFVRLDPNLPVFNVKTLTDQLSLAFFPARVAALLLGGFGFLALLLSGVGLFGVMSCAVNQRKREIGVRMALGANSAHIFKGVVGRGMVLTVIGVIVGLLLAAFGARLMTSLLYGAHPYDPLVFAGVPFVLAAVAFLACFFPARKATKVDPISVLRAE
jgi:predicted permease